MDFANTVINAAAGQAAIWHGLRGVNSTLAGGVVSGLQALAYATDLISSGQATTLLAGGADELCFESFYGFAKAGLLSGTTNGEDAYPIPFDARRNGFHLGEGAALFMLEAASSAEARGARILAEIKGHGSSYDLCRGTQPAPSEAAICRSIRLALQDAGLEAAQIDGVSASANGSRRTDADEAQALAAVFGAHVAELPVMAVKSMLGEMLGASGAMQSIALLMAMQTSVCPGIWGLQQLDDHCPLPLASAANHACTLRHGLVNGVGLDGHHCALVLSQHGVS
jgi:3-oxoacyl-[acyl-carrier-protein] synthase II